MKRIPSVFIVLAILLIASAVSFAQPAQTAAVIYSGYCPSAGSMGSALVGFWFAPADQQTSYGIAVLDISNYGGMNWTVLSTGQAAGQVYYSNVQRGHSYIFYTIKAASPLPYGGWFLNSASLQCAQ